MVDFVNIEEAKAKFTLSQYSPVLMVRPQVLKCEFEYTAGKETLVQKVVTAQAQRPCHEYQPDFQLISSC